MGEGKAPRKAGRRSERIVVRELEFRDLQGVYALGEALFTAEEWPTLYRSWDVYEVVEFFASDGETCLVAEQGERLVGFALGHVLEKPRSPWVYGHVTWVGVDPDAKRSGVGTRLLEALTERFLELGVHILLVDTEADNEPAIGFFERAGFGNRSEHVYLTKNLTRTPAYKERRARERRRAAGQRRRRARKPGPRG